MLCSYETKNTYRTTYDFNRAVRPVTASLRAPNGSGHAVIIVNAYKVTVKYKKTSSGKSYSKDYIYYVICDGWHNAKTGDKLRVSYVRSDYLVGVNTAYEG